MAGPFRFECPMNIIHTRSTVIEQSKSDVCTVHICVVPDWSLGFVPLMK